MIWPEPCARSTGSAALITCTLRMKLVSNCARIADMGMSSTDPTLANPALLITTSSRPNLSTPIFTACLAASKSVTSSASRQNTVAVARDELIELAGLTRCCNQLMSSFENRGRDAAAQAARATRQEKCPTHHALHGFD